jgi:thymidylate kinase
MGNYILLRELRGRESRRRFNIYEHFFRQKNINSIAIRESDNTYIGEQIRHEKLDQNTQLFYLADKRNAFLDYIAPN